MWLTLACCGIATSALAFLPLLPSQKAHVAQLAQLPPSRVAGQLMVALLAVLLIGGTGFAILPILPGTACLRIVGGSGCDE